MQPASLASRKGSGILLATLFLGACATAPDPESYKERLVDALVYPFGVTFPEETIYPGGTLCGTYNASSDGGLRYETGPFVVTPDLVLPHPTPDQMAVYCAEDPAEALHELTGIGGEDAPWDQLARIRDDMRRIDAAILRFQTSQYMIPRTLENMLEQGFIADDEMIRDPWGQPYRYKPGLSGGTTPRYDLETLGQDGAPGGAGADADVNKDQLEFLEHVLRMEGF
jgi:hypothetical protein